MLSRRGFLTGSLSAAGVAALPWTARGATLYKRRVGITTSYIAKSPVPMVAATASQPGYAPTLASVYKHLLQPGASPPATADPYTAALELVQKPWFNGLGSPSPLGYPPKAKLIRRTQFSWLDAGAQGFHPMLGPVKRLVLSKEAAIERTYFRERARLQTNRICKAMLRRAPRSAHPLDELAQGIRSLIKRKHVVEILPTTLPGSGFYYEEFEPAAPPASPFGATMNAGDYFPDVTMPADTTTTHAALEALAASAAFAEAAAIMGVGAVALHQAAQAAIGISTFGFASATGLSVLLSIMALGLAAGAVVIVYAVVTARPRGDGTYDIFAGFAPFGSIGGCNCNDLSTVTVNLSPAIATLNLELDIVDTAPIGAIPSDDGGAAPGDGGVAGDTGDGGDF